MDYQAHEQAGLQEGERPEPQPDLSSVAKEAMEEYALDVAADKHNRDGGFEDIQFAIGNQWDAAARAERERQGRPCLTFDRLSPAVKQVTGEIRKNKPAITITPGDGAATPETAKVMEGLCRAIERASGAQRIYVMAAEQACIYGQGHFRLSYEWADYESFEQELRVNPVPNPLSVVWDRESVRDDRSDAKRCFVYAELTKKEYEKAYPKAAPGSWDKAQPYAAQPQIGNRAQDVVTVCEYWKVEPHHFWIYQMRHIASGAVQTLLNPQAEEIQQYEAAGWVYVQRRMAEKPRIVMYLLSSANEVLSGPIEWIGSRIPIFPVQGEITHVGGIVFRNGLIRKAKDAQRTFNLARSVEAETFAFAPRVPFILTSKQIKGYENLWANANKGTLPYLLYNDEDAEDGTSIQAAKPSREPAIGTNPGFMAWAGQAADDIKATTGIYDASLGQRSNETSGVAIEARDAQADTGTFLYMDNTYAAVESMANEMVYIIPQLYSEREMVRLIGKDDQPEIRRLKEEGLSLARGKYDAIVQAGPGYASERKEAAKGMVDLIKAVRPEFQAPLMIRLAKLQDWEDAGEVAEEFRAIAMMAGLLPNPQAQMGPPMGPGGPDPMMGHNGGPPMGPPMPGPGMPPPGPGGPMPEPNVVPFNRPGAPQGRPPVDMSNFRPMPLPPGVGRVAPRQLPQGARGNAGA